MTTMTPWSAPTLRGDDVTDALTVFQESLPVQLIATGRSEFKTCFPEEALSEVVDRNRTHGFDHLPVVSRGAQGRETVIGVLEVMSLMSGPVPDFAVDDCKEALGEQHLIGADAGILTFIRSADRHPFRFVVSGHEISGLVTLSDLQRISVRAALFAMVTHLELTMAEVIRQRSSQLEAWIGRLPKERAQKVQRKLARAKREDTYVDELLYTEFCDKVTLITKDWPFPKDRSISKKVFKKDMRALEKLRNSIAHASDFAATREAARHLCERVRRADRWTRSLAACLHPASDSVPGERP
ncbi:MAG TPA: hypothetical protein VHB47_06340 [Thermoanaerobaculia bacterium]|jgi:CBS domain-containing protein|nr:hypothetical protein [Thermoanaerobaculia bacterium]